VRARSLVCLLVAAGIRIEFAVAVTMLLLIFQGMAKQQPEVEGLQQGALCLMS